MHIEPLINATEFKTIVKLDAADPRELLVGVSKLPARVVTDAMNKGAVWLRNRYGIRRLRRRSAKLIAGDELILNYDAAVLRQTCNDAQLVQDGVRWSAWWKPGGMRSQGSKWGDHTTLARFAEDYFRPQRTSFIVHRLDLAASGLMLLAHDKKSAAHLSRQFAKRTVDKRYHAVVRGQFPAGDDVLRYDSAIDGKSATSTARCLSFEAQSMTSLVEVCIETGRKHQIRRHLADAGFPIVGDRLYGMDDAEDLRLCAIHIAFDDPESGERIKIERMPDHWR